MLELYIKTKWFIKAPHKTVQWLTVIPLNWTEKDLNLILRDIFSKLELQNHLTSSAFKMKEDGWTSYYKWEFISEQIIHFHKVDRNSFLNLIL